MLNLETYLQEEEYKQVKLIDLSIELRGSTDTPDQDAKAYIFRVERMMIEWLIPNRDFSEDMIKSSEKRLNAWKFAVCDQIEECLSKGITTIDELARTEDFEVCPRVLRKLQVVGMANMRGY